MMDSEKNKAQGCLKNHEILLLILCAVSGIFILYPYLNFQSFLSQGDHGRDLYAFKETMGGATPYRDYWWVYGPLMPYYYSLFFKFFGINIQSILLGKMLLTLLSGIIFYLTVSFITTPSLAFLAAIWFWIFNPEFFYTYNHVGATCLLMGVLAFLFSYIKSSNQKYIYGGLACIFVLSLIKINIGFSVLLSFILSLCFVDLMNKNPFTVQKKIVYVLSMILLPLAVLIIYGFFVRGLPLHYIRQCFPYLAYDHPYRASLGKALHIFCGYHISSLTATWPNLFFGTVIILSVVQTFLLLCRKQFSATERNNILVVVFALFIFSFFNLHEFIASAVIYTLLWVMPFKFIFMSYVLYLGTLGLPRLLRYTLYMLIMFVAIQHTAETHQFIQSFKNPMQYLSYKRAKIYVSNSPEWLDTVNRTTDYLTKNLNRTETFLALPYDPLFYYLTDKQSPTRQLIFFEHINIPPEQEKTIIKELENKEVKFVVLSNRSVSSDTGLGIFGKTYCPLLGQYVSDHFVIVATFGNWHTLHPGWAWNYGTKIFKRIK